MHRNSDINSQQRYARSQLTSKLQMSRPNLESPQSQIADQPKISPNSMSIEQYSAGNAQQSKADQVKEPLLNTGLQDD